MACYFCKKRVWFWQKSYVMYHLKCYRDYLHGLLDEPLHPIFDTPELQAKCRQEMIKGLRELRDASPQLELKVPLK